MESTPQYHYVTDRLRTFFKEEKGFVEVPAAYRQSILAACEDPRTIITYSLGGVEYPLPQTGQMWLEIELMKNKNAQGMFCLGPSYRDEPFIIEGRHQRLFPMFDFESHGTIDDLRKLESDLLVFLGFEKPKSVLYEDACERYDVSTIEAEQEARMMKDVGTAITLERFPFRSNPFFVMKRCSDGLYNKIDVLLYGMETIGSAERSTNVEEMRELFFTTSEGKFAELLFTKFSKERVLKELEDYLVLPHFPRFGGGIGVTRLARAMQEAGLLDVSFTAQQQPAYTQPSL